MNRDVSKSFFRCLKYECSLAVLKPGESFTFYGAFSFRVLYGRVCVRSKVFSVIDREPISVSAPYLLGPPINMHACPKSHIEPQNGVKRIKKLAEEPDLMLDYFEATDSIILFYFKENDVPTFFASIYGPAFYIPQMTDNVLLSGYKVSSLCYVLHTLSYPPLFTSKFAQHIDGLVNGICYKREGGNKPIAVITGPKNAGKSTLARAVISILYKKNGSPVYLLDGDVGQAECTPPGCVSLHKVSSPLFDASIASQECTFSHCYFFGSVSPDTDIELYMVLIKDLLICFKEKSEPKSTLIINTCGWVEEGGLEILDFILAQSSPDFVFNLQTAEGTNYHVDEGRLSLSGRYVEVFNCRAESKTAADLNLPLCLPATTRRDMLTAGYFAKHLSLKKASALGDVAPLAVFFKTLHIYMHPSLGIVPETHIFASLNCTLVALCTVPVEEDKPLRIHRILNKDDMPFMIDEESVKLRCLGFGFIRAIDIEKRLFYVMTPVGKEALKKVNVFARGINIDLPTYFMTQQHCQDPPYVVSVKRSSLQSNMYKKLKLRATFKRFRKKRPFL